jgi:hypothetical protein
MTVDVVRSVLVSRDREIPGGCTLFQEYLEQRRVGQVHRPLTVTHSGTYLHLHAYTILGRRSIRAIRRGDTIFKAAVGDRLIAASQCIRIALPKKLDAR